MAMTLEEYLDAHSERAEEHSRAWEQTADLLAEQELDHVRKNVVLECRLSREMWEAIVHVLETASAGQLLDELTGLFQACTLQGPDVQDTPSPKGRAWGAGRFEKLMIDKEVFASPDAARQFIDDIRNDHEPAIPHRVQLRACPLGCYVMWTTFSEDGGHPFAGCTAAKTVRDGLGLLPTTRPEDQELVLLVYTVPDSISIHYPTIVEAYAGNDWNPLFECSSPDAPWGYTSGGWPEVVHEVIGGEHLDEPLRIVD